MATQLQIRRGTSAQVAAFTGAEGEVVVNTTNDSIHVNDGSTAGGFELARVDGSNWAITNAISTTANISFGDNDKAIFGAGSDLQIYHDGSQSVIYEGGTGPLDIRSNSETFIKNGGGTETLAHFANNGAVTLYHNNAAKLATTSTGIDVTGEITADALTINSSGVQIGTVLQSTSTTSARLALMDANTTAASQVGIGATGNTLGLYAGGGLPKVVVSGTGIDVTGTVTATAGAFESTGATEITLEDTDGGFAASKINVQNGGRDLKVTVPQDIIFNVGSSDAVTILNGGNVGIGTTNPDRAIKIEKDNAYVWIADAAGGNVGFIGGSGENDGLLRLYEGAGHTTKVEIHSDADSYFNGGNVGIGTSNPASLLQLLGSPVATSGALATFRNSDATSSNTTFGGILFNSSPGTDFSIGKANVNTATSLSFRNGNTGASLMDLTSAGTLLVGKTSAGINGEGFEAAPSGYIAAVRDGGTAGYFQRKTSNGEILNFRKDNTTVGSIGAAVGNAYFSGTARGWTFGGSNLYPANQVGAKQDNNTDLGHGSYRFDDIYATNGTIQTSDRNEKQDIEALSDAEQRVAVAAKGLLRKFRWINSVEENGDDARIHFGIIAQDLQDAFEAEGLDAGRYAMFISSTWTDEDGNEQTRLGVRYSELLAFIISAT